MEGGDRHGIYRQALASITLVEIYYGIEKSPVKKKERRFQPL
jgi:predicted nucleic acid-binding protein